jgi:hypothetical protein
MKRPRPAFVIGCVALIAAAGCSSGTKRDISQTVARNAVAVGMKKEFSDHDHSLEGTPTCRTASVKGSTTKVNVVCTGKTNKGENATLVGKTNGANEVRGTFTGSVNGVPLFTNDTCIGC